MLLHHSIKFRVTRFCILLDPREPPVWPRSVPVAASLHSLLSSLLLLLYQKQFWKEDLMAGLSVTMVSIPLNLAIALGSGVPPEVRPPARRLLFSISSRSMLFAHSYTNLGKAMKVKP